MRDVLLDFPELLVFSDFDALSDLPHGADFEPLLLEDLAEVPVEALVPPALLFPDLLAEEDVLLDFPELLVFSDFDALSDLPHGADFEPLLLEDLAEVPVEALVPPALLFPDLLAEEDVLNK
jgi:hypothetical protein